MDNYFELILNNLQTRARITMNPNILRDRSNQKRSKQMGSGRISNGEIRFTVRENQNGLHPFYRTLSFARISRLYRQINSRKQISCIISDFENESVLRTKRDKRWRNVLLKRSICAVCPVSFPTGRCLVTGMTA